MCAIGKGVGANLGVEGTHQGAVGRAATAWRVSPPPQPTCDAPKEVIPAAKKSNGPLRPKPAAAAVRIDRCRECTLLRPCTYLNPDGAGAGCRGGGVEGRKAPPPRVEWGANLG